MNAERIHALHFEIQKTFKDLKSKESDLIHLLQQMDREFGYKLLGYASLWEYAVKGLSMTESQASTYIVVSRRSMQIPALNQALASGDLSVSKAKRIASAIQYGEAEEWIEKAKTLSQKELEREIFRCAPQGHLDPKMRQPDRLYRITLSVTDQFLNQLDEASELLGEITREIALEKILKEFLDKKDPVRRAERARAGEKSKGPTKGSLDFFAPQSPTQSSMNEPSSRKVPEKHSRYIPQSIQNMVHLRDRGRCQHQLPNGELCKSRRGIHLHHIECFVTEGSHDPENLRTYCGNHHRLIHFQEELRLA